VPRAPHVHETLRCFCLGAFRVLAAEVEGGEELPFAFEEHGSPGRPALYEYRPLVRGFVEQREELLAARDDATLAVDELLREPAAAIYARAHAGGAPDERRAIFRSVLLPLLAKTAETCGGFDWDDGAFERAYSDLERSLFGDRRGYAAVAPLIGVSLGESIDLGNGIRVRRAAAGELAAHWPEAQGLLPPSFAREPDRLCVLELRRALPAEAPEVPDAPAELADAVTALRLATAGAIAAGPVLFERVDWRPYGIRAVVPLAATQPHGETTRLDPFRGAVARELTGRLALARTDEALADALDRWELALVEAERFRAEGLAAALAALLGGADGAWAAALRAAVLLGETAAERGELLARLRALGGDASDAGAADLVRRVLVETLLHGDRAALVASLDQALVGLRPVPRRALARAAAAV
jgi:hypothetical protein